MYSKYTTIDLMAWIDALRAHRQSGILGAIVLVVLGVIFQEAVKDLYSSIKKIFASFYHVAKTKLRRTLKQHSALQSPITTVSVKPSSEDYQLVSPGEFLVRLKVSKNLQSIIARTAEEFEKHGDWATLATLTHDAVKRDAVDEVNEVFRMPRVLGGVQNYEKVELTGFGLMLAGTAPNTSQSMARLAEICAQRKFDLQNEATIGTEILTTEYGFSVDAARRAYVVLRKIPGMVGTSSGSDDHWDAEIHHGALSYLKVHDAQGLLSAFARQVAGSIPPR
jgi:hypothetical protein